MSESVSQSVSQSGSQAVSQSVRDCKVVVNHCFTSLFGTNGLLSDIVIR